MHARSRLFALLAVLTLLLAACGGGDDTADTDAETPADTETPEETEAAEEGEEGTEEGEEVTRADADLVIWADDTRAGPMRQLGEQFGEDQGISVAVQEVPFDDIRDQLSVSGPAGEGPDVIVGAHDWLGELVANGVLAPIDLAGAEGEFSEAAIEAMSFDGQLYGVPYAVENLALYRNTEFVPDAPATWEELEETALALQEDGTVEQGLALPAAPENSPYFNYPLFTAFGGYVFGGSASEGYDTSDIGLDSDGGLAAAQAFGRWAEEGLINPSVDGALMQDLFADGRAAFAISGPWSLVQDGNGFTETGIDFEVSAIPPVEGGDPRPFVGVQGVMVSAFAENALLAQTFATEVMATEEGQLAMFEAQGRPPALTSAFEQVSAEDPVYQAFGEFGADGDPIPAIPEMASVFTAWGDAYTLIYQGQDPEQAFRDATAQIEGAIGEG